MSLAFNFRMYLLCSDKIAFIISFILFLLKTNNTPNLAHLIAAKCGLITTVYVARS